MTWSNQNGYLILATHSYASLNFVQYIGSYIGEVLVCTRTESLFAPYTRWRDTKSGHRSRRIPR